jgi:dTDP-4-amino-4,6-dideoxygalactose transaminase
MITGEGGMLTTNSDELAEKSRMLRSHGQAEKYLHPTLGLNYRMTEVEAAIGLAQLDRIDELVAKRRSNGAYLTAELAAVDGLREQLIPDGVEASYHQYSVVLEPGAFSCSRDEFLEALRAEGVGCAVHYPRPIHTQPAFGVDVSLPVSEDLAERIFSMPVHPGLTDEELRAIPRAVATVADRFGA